MKKVAVLGHYNTDNYGDLLLAKVIGDCIAEAGFEYVYPLGLNLQRGTALVRLWRLIRDVLTCDAAVFGGGGYFHGASGIRFLLGKYLPWLFFVTLLRVRRKPYWILGPGVTDLNDTPSRWMVGYICRHARSIKVRDVESARIIGALPGCEGVEITCDLVLSIDPETALSEIPADRRNLGLLHLESYFIDSERRGVIIEDLRAIKEDLAGCAIFFDRISDDELNARLSRELGIPVLPYENVDGVLQTIRNAAFVVSSKLHVCITAFLFGVPLFGVSTHTKTKRFFAQTKRAEYQQDGWPGADGMRAIIARLRAEKRYPLDPVLLKLRAASRTELAGFQQLLREALNENGLEG